jgi:hypothetical protein
MADEWMTKAMYHYRWWREEDQAYCSYWLVCSHSEYGPEETVRAMAQMTKEISNG